MIYRCPHHQKQGAVNGVLMGWGCHCSDSQLNSSVGIMGCVELGLDQAKEAREAAERTRPGRKPLPDPPWGQ